MTMFDSISSFHFLRPEYLLLLLLLPLMVLLLRKGTTRDNSWTQHINPILLRAMQGHTQQSGQKRARTWLLIALLALLIFASSGPSWIEKPQPSAQRSDNLIVILDLSLSMLAEDSPPSRLVRAKQKIVDLIRLRNEGNTALITFSGDSFIVTPLTDDTRTIESNLAALEPLIMPVIGSRPELAVGQAKALLEKAGAPRGRILLVTDGVAAHQAEKIYDLLRSSQISLNVIAVGTEEGAPIKLPDNRGYLKDSGSVVIAKTELGPLRALASNNGGLFAELALDDSDLELINVGGDSLLIDEEPNATTNNFDQWEDMGYLLLLFALPLCLYAYRQGGLLILCIALFPPDTEAFELIDLWKTKDQQAQEQALNGNYAEAAELFASERHKADALYRAGSYEQSAEIYSKFDNAEAHYNRGNALAKSLKLEEAIEAYERALEINPEDEQALDNKALVEQLLEQQEQQQQQQSGDGSEQQDSDQQNSDQNDSSDNDSGQQSSSDGSDESSQQSQQSNDQSEEQADNSDEEQSKSDSKAQSGQDDQSQEQSESTPQSSEDIQEMNEQAQQSGEEEQQSDEENGGAALTPEQLKALEDQAQADPTEKGAMGIEESLTPEEQRSYEQWMRRVPDDPSGLLRRKFEQQARERQRENNPEEPLW